MKKSFFILAFICSFFYSANSNAQSLSDLFNKENISKVVSAVSNNGNSASISIVGTWSYKGSAVELQSSNSIKNIGGKVAAETVEKSLDKQFTKLGIQQGISSFTFNTDSTFTVALKSKNQEGKYILDTENKMIDLTFAGKATISAHFEISNNEMTLTFDADKIVDAVSYISNIANNSTLKSVNSLLKSYDDVMAGFTLVKQK